ncbi:lachesin-like [Panonychus citri]|uniref:lachesin-like n=1 Tax=Panonychus citri TaxID=50023 RepID=UPI002306DFF0|nr:lachesin-like [Panonychus citri]XP_053210493.1 lachesin-like [Panonychus citri]XP_053210494.1 lachesin-like [Panonychus citri]XP_053210495.1 lachesin-like [Panonychus citri]XP_053210496.1 lachesin-like [Panonychus citri]XP_053210497.1 lachesin-like [Panonychus citri]XP_053210498.1 lachesin-like [Panonychus citri]XP_053210499.1 lachesin-like [Panonychus citri]
MLDISEPFKLWSKRNLIHWNQITFNLIVTLTFCIYFISQCDCKHHLITNNLSDPENEPEFISSIPNLTVQVGRDAQLPCTVDNLGSYKVAWLRVEDKGILTIHDHIITRNYRVSLTVTDNRNFLLTIKSVAESDKGGYMCQVNTVPMRSQVGYLDVVYPPTIIGDNRSDFIFNEGSNATLTCKAKGYPSPTILWKREDKKEIPLHNSQGKKYIVHNVTGETITISRVTRVHMGAYLCIASNGIPNSVSRRFLLQVKFSPVVWIPKQVIGSHLGKDVTLNCHIDSFPPSVNYWIKENGELIAPSSKYSIYHEDKEYKTHLSLVIRNVHKSDLGIYTCSAKNQLGSKEAIVTLIDDPKDHRIGSVNRKQQYIQVSERSPSFNHDLSKSSSDMENSILMEESEGLKSSSPYKNKHNLIEKHVNLIISLTIVTIVLIN